MNDKINCLVCILQPQMHCKCGFRVCEDHVIALMDTDSVLVKNKNKIFDLHHDFCSTCKYIRRILDGEYIAWGAYRIK